MKSYTLDDLARALEAVGVTSGDLVLVHSSLLALGRLEGHSPGDGVSAIAGRILDHLGPDGTLVVPAFNFGFCKGQLFDRQTTPAENMGQLSEHVRRLPGARRSAHPMQSIAAVGPRAEEICQPDTLSSFDPDGPFARLNDLGARLLLLGASMDAASFVHFGEERARVPYRYWKDFSAEYIDGDVHETRTYRMYVRDLVLDPDITLAPIETELRSREQLLETTLGAGRLLSCRFPDFLSAELDLLHRNPMCLAKTAGTS